MFVLACFCLTFPCFLVVFPNRLIPVTVDTFDTPKRYESSTTMTIMRMATATRLIPVTVDTFDTQERYERRRFLLQTLNAGPCFTSYL